MDEWREGGTEGGKEVMEGGREGGSDRWMNRGREGGRKEGGGREGRRVEGWRNGGRDLLDLPLTLGRLPGSKVSWTSAAIVGSSRERGHGHVFCTSVSRNVL